MKSNFIISLKPKFEKLWGYALWALILFLALSIVKNLGQVRRIRGEIAKEKEKITKIQAQNEELKRQVSETQTLDFTETEIRNKLGLVKEGETEVILPDAEVLKKLAPKLDFSEDLLPDPNWKKWLKLFL